MNYDLQISHLSVVSDALPVLTGAWFYRNISPRQYPFYVFFFLVALQDYFSVLLSLFHIYNVWMMNLYQLVEVVFYMYFFHRFVFERKFSVQLYAMLAGACLLWMYTTGFVYEWNEPNSIMRVTTGLVVVCYSGMVLLKLCKDVSAFLFSNPFFWLASGGLIYFSITLLVYSVFPVIVGNNYVNPIFRPVWAVHSVTNIFCNLLFAISFLCPNSQLRYQPVRSSSFLPSL